MERTILRRMTALPLIFLMLLAAALPAVAAGTQVQAVVTTTIRAQAATNAREVGSFVRGAVAEKLGTKGQWTLIDCNGSIGYVWTADVSSRVDEDLTPEITGGGNRMVAKANVNVRSGPGTGYSRIGSLSAGDVVERKGEIGGWSVIDFNGRKAYVSSNYLMASVSLGNTPSASAPAEAAPKDVVYITGLSELRRRASGSRLAYVFAGGRAVRIGPSVDRYAHVEIDGLQGYVQESNTVEVTGTGAYEFTDGFKWMYTGSKSVRAYIAPLEENRYRKGFFDAYDRVFVIAGNGYWSQVFAGDTVGYVPNSELYGTPQRGSGVRTTNEYKTGEYVVARRGGAPTYSTVTKIPYSAEVDEGVSYGLISEGTEMVVAYTTGDFACVLWNDDRKDKSGTRNRFGLMHMAFVDLNDIE